MAARKYGHELIVAGKVNRTCANIEKFFIAGLCLQVGGDDASPVRRRRRV
jgi:hypothetical protein